MKYLNSPSLGRALDRIEIVRQSLRWSSELDRNGISKLLRQVGDLREEILMLSGIERYEQKLISITSQAEKSSAQRRQALMNRNFSFEGVFGENEKLLETLETVEKAAKTDMPILIEGESGVGKELLSRVVHANSQRSDLPFISVNCGAISPNLLESELFGHVRGAFTGSVKDRKGKFESADNGTIFLDEIGELPHESQVKLLRVLENGEIQRVGSDDLIRVNTRIVAATNRNLREMMKQGKFREDLYYRLSVISVTLPPLRERRDELDILTDYFCKEASEKMNREPVRLSPRLRNFLLNYSYPGNIRELRNIIYRLVCLAEHSADLKHLPDAIRPEDADKPLEPNEEKPLETIRKNAGTLAQKSFLEGRLREVKGNVSALAKNLEMNRSYLSVLLSKNGIKPSQFRIQA